MKQSIRFWYACGIALCSYLAISPTQALPVPDATLPNNSVVTNQGNISTITGGTRAGGNLFHSFSEFTVPTRGVAFFNNALSIQNIISRVTGGSVSNIDGLIRANGKANLFLINPNGFIFDRNASLNIGGSFVASTASSLKFADGTQFSATAPQTTPLLTISVPIGLQFGANPGSIVNRSQVTNSDDITVGLQVDTGKSLALVGGNVGLDGGSLTAPGSRVELGGLTAAGTVGLNSDGSLSYPEGVQRADVSLTNGAYVDVRARGGGSIAINARNLDISGESVLHAGIAVDMGAVGSKAGDIELRAQGKINIAHSSIDNIVEGLGNGGNNDGGNIDITAGSLSVTDGASLQTDMNGQGNAGSVNINASGSVTFDGSSDFGSSNASTYLASTAEGNAGNINITAGSLSLTNDALLNAETDGQGNAGSVNINARDTVSFNSGFASTAVGSTAVGNGGNINITSGSLSATNYASLESYTFGRGNAGSVNINARDTVSFNNVAFASTAVGGGAVGNGGNVNITAGSLSLTNNSRLIADTYGQGDAGSVNIQASGPVSFDGELSFVSNGVRYGYPSGVFSRLQSGAMGNGGKINITAGELSLTNGAQVSSTVEGVGSGGIIRVDSNAVNLVGVGPDGSSSGLFTSTGRGASGPAGDVTVNTSAFGIADGAIVSAQTLNPSNGGSVTINAKTFEAANGGQVVTTTSGSGNAGNITLNVPSSVTLSGSDPTYANRLSQFGGDVVVNQGPASGLFANTTSGSTGSGGSIKIKANTFDVANGGQLSTTTAGTGRAGDITLKVLNNVTLQGQNSGIFANTATGSTGSGGSISIDPIGLSIAKGAIISVGSLGTGNAGSILAQANSLLVDQGEITANSVAGKGGNINLQIPDLLLLRHGSQISAVSGTAGSNGVDGNINIGTKFLVAFPSENSHIVATGYGRSPGSNIKVNAQGIFGIQYQKQQTPESDIVATGTVNLNAPQVDPSRGLVALPAVVVDTSRQIAQGCAAGNGTTGSQFVITGRGGLPPNPSEPLSSDAVWSDTRLPATTVKKHHEKTVTARQPSPPAAVPMVPATGWVFNGKGEVTLTASAPTEPLQIPRFTPASCHAQ